MSGYDKLNNSSERKSRQMRQDYEIACSKSPLSGKGFKLIRLLVHKLFPKSFCEKLSRIGVYLL